MKHIPFLFLLSGALLFGADTEDFDRIVDFSVSIENLDEIFQGREPFDREKLVILDGTLESISVTDKNAGSFTAIAVLVKGVWKSLDEIRVDRCTLLFSGSGFAGRISGRISDDPGTVGLNDRVLVVGKLGVMTSADGNPVRVVEVKHIRTL